MPPAKPATPNDLPAELVLQIEAYLPSPFPADPARFLKQITSPTHPAPLTPEQVSNLFQDFYTRTFNLLPTLLPSPSTSTINLQPLLTGTQISDRKRQRSEVIIKRAQHEEEIEKRVTTALYDRIFALKSADDAERDLKLESKLEALLVVGVELEHLGVELSEREKEFLRPAVEAIGLEFRSLDGVYCPREKLEVLVRVHKILVDGLTFPGENGASTKPSSADLLLPVLIYRSPSPRKEADDSIIQAKAETLISNIQFIQRFRADSLLQGEASYCLTNLVPPLPHTTPDPAGSRHRLS
jgi:Vacuolar sorting protein 9 (VPS9) domain